MSSESGRQPAVVLSSPNAHGGSEWVALHDTSLELGSSGTDSLSGGRIHDNDGLWADFL